MLELAEEAQTRQGLYRLAGEILRPPAMDTLVLLGSATEIMDSRGLERFSYAMAWHRLVDAITGSSSIGALEPEYVRLFGVGVSGTPATPTESFYRIPKRKGGVGDFVAQLQSEYRHMGLSLARTEEPPDHISTELDAMACLTGAEAEAWRTGIPDEAYRSLESQELFLDRHLSVWVPLFVARAKAASPCPFYSAVVDFLHSFIVHEGSMVPILRTELAAT